MSSRLITQLAEETPQVLLISSENNLKNLIGNFYSRQGLKVVFLDIGETAQSEINKALGKEFYKTVVLRIERENNPGYFLKLKNSLVIKLVSSVNFNEEFLSSLGKNFILGLDVITKTDKSWSVFDFITRKITAGIILDPKINCYPQSEELFFQTIKNPLISPSRKQILIRGKKHSSGVIVDETSRLIELFYNKKTQKTASMVRPLEIDFSEFEVVNQKTEALPSLLESKVRKILFSVPRKATQTSFSEKNLEKPTVETANLDKKSTTPVEQRSNIENLDQIKENLDEKLNQIFKTERIEKKSEDLKQTVKITKKIVKKTKKKKTLFFLGLIFTILAVCLSVLTGVFLLSELSLKRELMSSIGDFSSQAKDNNQKNAQVLKKLTKKANFLDQQVRIYDNFLPPDILVEAKALTEVSLEVIEQSDNLASFESNLEMLVSSFLGKELLPNEQIAQKMNQASQANYKVISRLISRLKTIRDLEKNLKQQTSVKELISLLEAHQKSLTNFQQLYPIVNSLIGLDGKKVYAIVFQNNQELRPTGGFIQAVALVVVDQGMIVDIQTFSSYELDKRLGGAVIPPDEVISLLGENKWYLRDSNWNSDFEATGKQITWFLEQETDKKIDGVIGVNLFTLANLLRELGPLELSEFNEVITDKNIFERSEFHSEIKLVESNEIKDYQTKFFQTLLQNVVEKGQEKPFGLLKALSKSLKEKQLTVYFRNPDQETIFSALDWTGKIVSPNCPAQFSTLPCQVDSLAVVDANIGINKANFHTTREDQHLVELEKNQVRHTRTITLDNTAFVNAWPKGSYKSYLRFYLPASTQTISLKMDGQVMTEKNFSLKEENGRLVLGFVSETPIKTQKNIELSYVVPLEFSLPYSYVFFNQKQPGTDAVLPEIVFKYDSVLSPTLIAPQAEVQGTAIVFGSLGEDHAFVGASFK